ncbi:MAG: hypothetical protein ACREJO_02070 [Phycisphaerales bacterium]
MSATISLPLLDRARVAAPCPAKWEDMTGDNKVRHCALCNLNVHNFSAMSRDEAEGIFAKHFNPDGSLIESAGRVCGGFYRRADGTYLLQDCPTGLAAIKARVRNAWIRVAAAIGLIGSAAFAIDSKDHPERAQQSDRLSVLGKVAAIPSPVALKANQPFRSAWAFLRPPAQQTRGQVMVAGSVCVPPSPPAPSTGSNR